MLFKKWSSFTCQKLFFAGSSTGRGERRYTASHKARTLFSSFVFCSHVLGLDRPGGHLDLKHKFFCKVKEAVFFKFIIKLQTSHCGVPSVLCLDTPSYVSTLGRESLTSASSNMDKKRSFSPEIGKHGTKAKGRNGLLTRMSSVLYRLQLLTHKKTHHCFETPIAKF